MKLLLVVIAALSISFGHAAKDEKCNKLFDIAKPDEEIVHYDPYRRLEANTPERKKWLAHKNQEVQDFVEGEPAHDFWNGKLREIHSEEKMVTGVALKNGWSLRTINRGLNKPNDTVLFNGKNEVKTIVSSHNKEKTGSYKLWPSPKRDIVLVPIVKDGSIDIADIHVVDVASQKVVEVIKNGGDYGVTWLSNNEFVYSKYVNRDRILLKHKLGHNQRFDQLFEEKVLAKDNSDMPEELFEGTVHNGLGNKYLLRYKKGKTHISSLAKDGEFTLDYVVSTMVYESDEYLLVSRAKKSGWEELVMYKFVKGPTDRVGLSKIGVVETSRGIRGRTFNLGDQFLVSYSNGHNYWANLYSKDGKLTKKISIPNCCSLTGVKKLPNNQFEMSFTSRVRKSGKFIYNLDTQRFTAYNINKKMMTDTNGVEYVNKFIFSTSKDGKTVPARIVYRKDMVLDGNNPTFMEGYGGFNVSGYMAARYQEEHKTFIEHGGIYVAPALRGGNELGPRWHEDAMFEKKINTFNDGLATIKNLISQNYTKPEKIALTGWSNGGLFAGAMAAIYGDYIKFAIPGNGVQNLLMKESFDPRFANGWSYEYGNSNQSRHFKHLSKISPVDVVSAQKKDYPATLIIVGNQDSRVNPIHSYKLAAAFENSNTGSNPMLMYSIENAGHWVMKEDLQDMRAFKTKLIQWSSLYIILEVKIPKTN